MGEVIEVDFKPKPTFKIFLEGHAPIDVHVNENPDWGDLFAGYQMEVIYTPESESLVTTEETLFGWSCTLWDENVQQWFTLPNYFISEEEALDVAEKYQSAIYFNPYNDDGEWI